jgi:hypothetical protein
MPALEQHRQSEIDAREGVDLERSTLAGWVAGGFALHPINRLEELLPWCVPPGTRSGSPSGGVDTGFGARRWRDQSAQPAKSIRR